MALSRREILQASAALGASTLLAQQLTAARPPVIGKIATVERRVWISAKINGDGPHLFVIDTGAEFSLLHNSLGKKLRLPVLGGLNVHAIGGRDRLTMYKAQSVLIGGAIQLNDIMFSGTDRVLGEDAKGSFGVGLFTSRDSDLDFEKGEWRLYPDGRADFAGLTQIPAEFSTEGQYASRIFLTASLDGMQGKFVADTGSPGQVSLIGPSVNRSGLWTADRPYAPSQSVGISGNPVRTRTVRANRLKLGAYVFEKVLVKMNRTDPAKVIGHDPLDGIVGLNILSRMHLSTNSRTSSLWGMPNRLAVPDETYGMSGLWVDPKDGYLLISDVGTGSPAAAAGLRVGDRIVGLPMPQYLDSAMGVAGSSMAFDYERDKKRNRAEFTLRDYL